MQWEFKGNGRIKTIKNGIVYHNNQKKEQKKACKKWENRQSLKYNRKI
jgi:hypothetical protein